MSKDGVKLILTALLIAGLIGAGVFGGYQWSEAKNAKTIAALNKQIYDLGVELQNEQNKQGELNRELKLANRGRIDAIKLNDHNTDKIRKLQTALNVAGRELDDTRRYIVLNVDAVKRVYDETRNECYGLPDANDPALISAQLSEFTGDSITGVVRDLAGRYCSVATDYNSLYATCETLLAGKTTP